MLLFLACNCLNLLFLKDIFQFLNFLLLFCFRILLFFLYTLLFLHLILQISLFYLGRVFVTSEYSSSSIYQNGLKPLS
nr:MAG TPA: hypothetical protein [Caudoviricetes sp.]